MTLLLVASGIALLGYALYSRGNAAAPARAPRLDMILGSVALFAALVHLAR